MVHGNVVGVHGNGVLDWSNLLEAMGSDAERLKLLFTNVPQFLGGRRAGRIFSVVGQTSRQWPANARRAPSRRVRSDIARRQVHTIPFGYTGCAVTGSASGIAAAASLFEAFYARDRNNGWGGDI
jgi:hypothetical protein